MQSLVRNSTFVFNTLWGEASQGISQNAIKLRDQFYQLGR